MKLAKPSYRLCNKDLILLKHFMHYDFALMAALSVKKGTETKLWLTL